MPHVEESIDKETARVWVQLDSDYLHALSIIHIMKHSMNAFHNCHSDFAALGKKSSNHISRDEKIT